MAKSGRSSQMTLFDCIKEKRPGTAEQSFTKKGKFGIKLGASSTEIHLELDSAVNNEISTAILSRSADPSTPESESHLEPSANSSNDCIPAVAVSLPSCKSTPQIRLPDRLDDIASAITFSPVQMSTYRCRISSYPLFKKSQILQCIVVPNSSMARVFCQARCWFLLSLSFVLALEVLRVADLRKPSLPLVSRTGNMQLVNMAFSHAMPTATRTSKLWSLGTSTNSIWNKEPWFQSNWVVLGQIWLKPWSALHQNCFWDFASGQQAGHCTTRS